MEPVLHIVIPIVLMLALIPKYKKEILMLSPLTFILDFDLYIPNMHRAIFHNFLAVLLITGVIYLIFKKKAAIIGFFYLISHLILDLDWPGVAFLYPFYKKLISINIAIKGLKGEFFRFYPTFAIRIEDIQVLETFKESVYFTTFGFRVILLVVVAILIYFLMEKIKD